MAPKVMRRKTMAQMQKDEQDALKNAWTRGAKYAIVQHTSTTRRFLQASDNKELMLETAETLTRSNFGIVVLKWSEKSESWLEIYNSTLSAMAALEECPACKSPRTHREHTCGLAGLQASLRIGG